MATSPISTNEYDYIRNNTGNETTPFYFRVVDNKGEDQPLNEWGVSNAAGLPVFALRMNIAPMSVSMNMSKIVNRTQTMTAWTEDHWGDELDTITLTGSTAAFVVGANANKNFSPTQVDPAIPPSSYGLTTAYRGYSVSYQEMKALLHLMRSNGAQFNTDALGLVTERNFIRLSFDLGTFDGYIESFDLSEDSATPFKMTYTITFKSEKTVFSYIGV